MKKMYKFPKNFPRRAGRNFRGPHLLFTLMGDLHNPANSCFSYVGRVGGVGEVKGQVVNLGSPDCLRIGMILHEVLHALGNIFPF